MSDRADAIEHSRRARNQNTLAEVARVAVKRACVTLDLPDNAATAKLCAEALRNAAQTFQLRADFDVDPALGEAEAFTKAGQ